MIVLGGAILGALWGAWLAHRRKGTRLDMVQYGAGFAIFFAILGLFVTLFLEHQVF
jgi:hypothetical protein